MEGCVNSFIGSTSRIGLSYGPITSSIDNKHAKRRIQNGSAKEINVLNYMCHSTNTLSDGGKGKFQILGFPTCLRYRDIN